jgi:drug/metabolite transporter (DMT)-like permease
MSSTSAEIKKANIQMHLSIILWGFTAVLGRGISLQQEMLVWWRMLIVSATLLVYLLYMRKSLQVSGKSLWQMIAVGLLLMVHWLFFYGAIKHSNVSITLSCFATTSLFTALFEPLVTDKKFNPAEIGFSVLAIVGIGLIFYDGAEYSTGIFYAIMAAFIGSFFNIFNKPIVQQHDAAVVSFYEITAGFIGLTALVPLYVYFYPDMKLMPEHNDWWLLIVLAVACTNVTMILSLKALKHLSAFTLNLAINLEPVYGIALAFLFFGENKLLHTQFYLGTGIILSSVLLHAFFTNKKTMIMGD